MSTTLTNGLKLPDKGSVDWYADMQSNYAILDGAVGTIAEHTSALSGKAPLVHTHGKADITDLFNSANTWTGDNTFKGNIYQNQGDTNFIIPRGTNTIKGDLTTSGSFTLMFKDKNNGNLATSGIGYLTFGQNSSGSYTIIGVETVGSTDNTRHSNSISFRIDPTTNDNTAQFYPVNNNATDLGDSTHQWNNLYAKNYYYNGVAWGLDKQNEWTNFQRMTSNPAVWYLRNNTVTLGSTPSSNRYIGMFFEDVNGADLGYASFQANKNSYNSIMFSLCNSDGTNKYTGVLRYRASTTGAYCFFPETSECDLGISTNKWKTLNGVNPGALSLPDYSKASNIDTTNWNKNGTLTSYTPTMNGWLQITLPDDADNNGKYTNKIIILDSKAPNPHTGQASATIGDIRIYLTYPVIANRTYYLYIKSYSNTISAARFIPCQGNV